MSAGNDKVALKEHGAPVLSLDSFRQKVEVSMESICLDIYRENREKIKIKKEAVAVRNLVTIFNATLKLSNSKGFQAMSLRDLSAESQLSMGALYSYFDSKDDLLDIIQEQGRRIATVVLNEQIDSLSDPWQKLVTFIRSHLYLTEVIQPWFYFSYMETKNLTRAQQKRAIESELYTEKVFEEILLNGEDSGRFAVVNRLLTASVIKAMLQDWYLKRWKYTRRNISVEEYADFLVTLVGRFVLMA